MNIIKKNIAIVFIAATLFGASGVYAQQSQTQQQQIESLTAQLRVLLVQLLEQLQQQWAEQQDNDLAFKPANIKDVSSKQNADDIIITINGTDGGCEHVQEPTLEKSGKTFSIELMASHPTATNVACTADIRYFSKEVVIDTDDLSTGDYTVVVNDDKEISFTKERTSTIPQQQSTDIKTSVKSYNVSGANNDYVVFQVKFDLHAFGNRAYVSENASAFNYSITNANTGTVVYDSNGVQNGQSVSSVSSEADLEGSSYRLDNGDSAKEFIFTATYNPHTGGTPPGSGSYRLLLDSVEYSFTPGGATQLYNTGLNTRFRTSSVNIVS